MDDYKAGFPKNVAPISSISSSVKYSQSCPLQAKYYFKTNKFLWKFMTTESTDSPAAPSKIQKTRISSKENWAPVAEGSNFCFTA